MEMPTKEGKGRSGAPRVMRTVFYSGVVVGAFLLGTMVPAYVPKKGTDPQPKQVVADLSKLLQGSGASEEKFSPEIDMSLMYKVKSALNEKYLRTPLSDQDLYYGAIKGMVASLNDPYTVFFDPKEAKQFADELNGEFEGIGAEIGLRNNYVTVIAPLPESPAMKAGLRAKDIIVKIDDKYTDGMSTDQAVRLIRGKGGTQVKLLILHEKSKSPNEVVITRAPIVFQAVRSKMLPSGYADIEVFHFNEDTPKLFKQAISDSLAKNPRGWILDLRNNPGGLLSAAVDMLGEFIPNEVAVQEKDKTGVVETLTAYGEGRLKGKNVVVLVNGGSASASEIVSGCLQDYKAATLIGDQTFGKGVVQQLQDMEGGAELKVTVAEWLTGKGRSIDKVGIAPDIKVEMKPEDANADRDPQLDRAVQFLKTGK